MFSKKKTHDDLSPSTQIQWDSAANSLGHTVCVCVFVWTSGSYLLDVVGHVIGGGALLKGALYRSCWDGETKGQNKRAHRMLLNTNSFYCTSDFLSAAVLGNMHTAKLHMCSEKFGSK